MGLEILTQIAPKPFILGGFKAIFQKRAENCTVLKI